MKLSTRVRYAVRAMVELAMQPDGNFVSLRELADKQDLSVKYLEQIISELRTADLVFSIRGAEGGYRLAKPAQKITVWENVLLILFSLPATYLMVFTSVKMLINTVYFLKPE